MRNWVVRSLAVLTISLAVDTIPVQNLSAASPEQLHGLTGRWNMYMHYTCTAREVRAGGLLCGVQPVGYRYTGDFEANSDNRGRFHYHNVLLEYVAQASTKRWCGGTSRRQPVTRDYCYSTISGSGFIKADQPQAPHTPEFWPNNETTTYHAINPVKNVTIHSVGPKPLFPMPTELPAVPGTYTIGKFYRQAGFDASVVARYPVRDFIMIVTHRSV